MNKKITIPTSMENEIKINFSPLPKKLQTNIEERKISGYLKLGHKCFLLSLISALILFFFLLFQAHKIDPKEPKIPSVNAKEVFHRKKFINYKFYYPWINTEKVLLYCLLFDLKATLLATTIFLRIVDERNQ